MSSCTKLGADGQEWKDIPEGAGRRQRDRSHPPPFYLPIPACPPWRAPEANVH